MPQYRRWLIAWVAVVLIADGWLLGRPGEAPAPAPDPVPVLPRRWLVRAEYEAALARWQAQHIAQYEITVGTMAISSKDAHLRVSNGGQTIEVLGPNGVTPPSPEDLNYYQARTVEGMFAYTKALLDHQPARQIRAVRRTLTQVINGVQGALGNRSPLPAPPAPVEDGDQAIWGYDLKYDVRYDSKFGYITMIESEPDTNHIIFDAATALLVDEFKVLQRATP
jgi:hypothetical protein